MSTRSSSLNAYTTTSISREIDSKYDLIKTVADKIDDVETVAGMDLSGTASAIEALNDELQAIKDSGVATGAAGVDGIDGISAYEVAVNNGYTGTEVEWLASLKGAKGNDGIGYAGKSAYTIAVDNGFVGTQTEWLESLVGNDGADGHSPIVTASSTDGILSVVVDGVTKTTLDVVTVVADEVASNVDIVAVNATKAEMVDMLDTASGYATDAATSAASASASVSTTNVLKADVVQLKADVVGINTEIDGKLVTAETKVQEANAAKVLAETYRNDALNYLAEMRITYDLFDDRFYGAHATNPTTDHDGFAIEESAMYWNTTSKELLIYTGSVWAAITSDTAALHAVHNLADVADIPTARSNLGVYSTVEVDGMVGTVVQPYDPNTVVDSAYVHTDNNYTTAEKDKLAAISDGAEVNVNADWNAIGDDAEILNKPTTISGYGITDAYTKSEVNTNISTAVDAHTARVDNPHAVTKAQVGLSEVDNTSDLTKWAAVATLTNKTIDSITNRVGADHVHYKVKAAGNLVAGNVVKITGYNSGEDAVEVNIVTSASDVAVGIVEEAIAVGAFGAVTNTGMVEDLDTSVWGFGTILYSDGAGGLTSTKPASGEYQACAVVLRQNVNTGALLVEFSEPQKVDWDDRYYTESEIDAKLAAQNDAVEIVYDNGTSGLVATEVQGAIDEMVADRDSTNQLRADKYLAAQNIVNMLYTDGNLVKIRYKVDADTDYEVLSYTSGNLTSIDHYVGSVLQGTTTLSYTDGSLVSAVFA